MAHSITTILLLAASILTSVPIRTTALTSLTCYSSFQFVPSNYSTCATLRDKSTLAWSLKFNNTLNPNQKYLKGLFVSTPRKPGGWVSFGFNTKDNQEMANSAVLACYNTIAGPKVVQLWLTSTENSGVAIDDTKKRLNVTRKKCFIQSTTSNGVAAEKIYIQFEITLGAKAKFISVYAKGPTSATGKGGIAGTAMLEHVSSDGKSDRGLRDFRETSVPGLVEPRPPSPPSPPKRSPPFKRPPLSGPPRPPPMKVV